MSSFFKPPDLVALARLSSIASGEFGDTPPTMSFRDFTSAQPGSFSLSKAWCIRTGTITSFFVIFVFSQFFKILSKDVEGKVHSREWQEPGAGQRQSRSS